MFGSKILQVKARFIHFKIEVCDTKIAVWFVHCRRPSETSDVAGNSFWGEVMDIY